MQKLISLILFGLVFCCNDTTELLHKVIRIQESYLYIISFLSRIIRFSHHLATYIDVSAFSILRCVIFLRITVCEYL